MSDLERSISQAMNASSLLPRNLSGFDFGAMEIFNATGSTHSNMAKNEVATIFSIFVILFAALLVGIYWVRKPKDKPASPFTEQRPRKSSLKTMDKSTQNIEGYRPKTIKSMAKLKTKSKSMRKQTMANLENIITKRKEQPLLGKFSVSEKFDPQSEVMFIQEKMTTDKSTYPGNFNTQSSASSPSLYKESKLNKTSHLQ